MEHSSSNFPTYLAVAASLLSSPPIYINNFSLPILRINSLMHPLLFSSNSKARVRFTLGHTWTDRNKARYLADSRDGKTARLRTVLFSPKCVLSSHSDKDSIEHGLRGNSVLQHVRIHEIWYLHLIGAAERDALTHEAVRHSLSRQRRGKRPKQCQNNANL